VTFVNPYTFIPLGNDCVRTERQLGPLTGVLYCTLKTLSPLIIPNVENDHAFPDIERVVIERWNNNNNKETKVKQSDHKSYDFFSYENSQGDRSSVFSRPIIPGSSLRGVIRSAFEAITDSCLSTVDEEMLLHRRNPEAYKKYGVIENGQLFEAEKVLIHTDAKGYSKVHYPIFKRAGQGTEPVLKTGTELWITRSKDPFKSSRGFKTENKWVTKINPRGTGEQGYFLAGEQFGTGNKKHFDAVMVKKPIKSIYTLTSDDEKRLLTLSNLYRDSSIYYKGWINANPMPVYYDVVDGKYYFSPACISQEVFHRKLGAMLGQFKPCSDVSKPCEACSVFGMVAGNDGALSSRVSFRDALPVDCSTPQDWFDDPKTLPILGSPHITSSEFYQVDPDPDADYFNADYKVTRPNRDPIKVSLTDQKSQIRGRKFYWHTEPRLADQNQEKPNQNNTFRAVKRDRTFAFEVRFERLTETELAKLIWVLEIGGKAANAHKLGHGKPVGYGSVSIQVDKKKSVIFEIDNELSIIESRLPELATPSLKNDAGFLKVTNYEDRPKNVNYPKGTVRDVTNIYSWFGLNRQGGQNTKGLRDQNRAKIFNILPNLLDDSQELPNYKPNDRLQNAEPLSFQYTSNRSLAANSNPGRPPRGNGQPKHLSPQAITLKDEMELRDKQKMTKLEPSYGTYKAKVIKAAILEYKLSPKSKQTLSSFVDDFERAKLEKKSLYNDFIHLYQPAKEKLGND
jgi:CRISPR-associated protein (TIGR03986 family)